MKGKNCKQLISLTAAVLAAVLLIIPMALCEEHYPWDCPNPECGEKGLTTNYCRVCGHPAPWIENSSGETPTPTPTPEDTPTKRQGFVVITPEPTDHEESAAPVSGDATQDLISAECRYPAIVAGSVQEFTVITKPEVQNLMLYSEDGFTLVKAWTATESSVITSEELRMWTVSQSVKSAGNRTLIFKGGKSSTAADTNQAAVSFKVENAGVISAEGKYAAIAKKSEQVFTVVTTADMKHLMFYSENGKLLKTWNANQFSTVSNSVRTWTVSYSINNPGDRVLAFKAGATSEPTDAMRIVPFKVLDTGVQKVEPETVYMNRSGTNTITVRTTSDADFLALYEVNGTTPLKQWTAGGSSTADGDVRTWTISLEFSETGERTLVLKAGTGGTPAEAGRAVSFILAEAKIFSAEGKYAAIAKGGVQVFTVVTSQDVDRLMIYAEDGSKMLTNWNAYRSSVIGENNLRIWTVERKIKNAGNRKLIFKGGITTWVPVTNEIKVPFKVESSGVISVNRKNMTVKSGSKQVFTVKTTSDAMVLFMYEEDGTTLIESWTADNSNSKLFGSIRTWTVSHAFMSAGTQSLIFRAGPVDVPTNAEQSVSFEVK